MKIILTNDDGINSPVLTALANTLHADHEVIIVAPATDQSGMSQAFTHGQERYLTYHLESLEPYPRYKVTGTPCDCVKFAIADLQKEGKVDLVLSGINLGENAGMSAVYSGTVAAAREGAMWGIPSIAVSVWKNAPDHLEYAVAWVAKLLRTPALLPLRPGGLWNINFPPCNPDQIDGAEITSMSTVMFVDSYEPKINEQGQTQFRLVGYKPQELFIAGSDDYALVRNRIAITPLKVEQSDSAEAYRLAGSEFKAHWDSLS